MGLGLGLTEAKLPAVRVQDTVERGCPSSPAGVLPGVVHSHIWVFGFSCLDLLQWVRLPYTSSASTGRALTVRLCLAVGRACFKQMSAHTGNLRLSPMPPRRGCKAGQLQPVATPPQNAGTWLPGGDTSDLWWLFPHFL